MNKKRYVVEMDYYLWASNDEDAKKQAEINKTLVGEDSDARVQELHEIPFGKMIARRVELR